MDDPRRLETEASLSEPLAAEDAFFGALVEADLEALERLLASDFVIVDVSKGAEIARSALLDAVARRLVEFVAISVVDRRLRRYGEVAVVVGRTAMRGRIGGEPFTVASRYTHVLVSGGAGGWRLVSAQGTEIVE